MSDWESVNIISRGSHESDIDKKSTLLLRTQSAGSRIGQRKREQISLLDERVIESVTKELQTRQRLNILIWIEQCRRVRRPGAHSLVPASTHRLLHAAP